MNSLELLLSDEGLAVVVPIVVYWVYSGMYLALGQSMDKYRLHPRREEDSKNLVSKRDVVKAVLSQQLVQAIVAVIGITVNGDRSHSSTIIPEDLPSTSYLALASQFAVGMVVMDVWQYGWHRFMHSNMFLYRHIHSWHHRLLVPYPYGTLYAHPAETLWDTLGIMVAFTASGMSPRASIFFFSFITMKTVDDHCGLMLPWNLFHRIFWNNTAYHDVHHQRAGTKYNFSVPFFVSLDKVFGTHMPYMLEERPEGGLQARLVGPLVDTASRNGKEN